MFKSIETYVVTGSTTGITINGSGIVYVIRSAASYLEIDGQSTYQIQTDKGNYVSANYLFKESCRIYNISDNDAYSITVKIGLF